MKKVGAWLTKIYSFTWVLWLAMLVVYASAMSMVGTVKILSMLFNKNVLNLIQKYVLNFVCEYTKIT